MMQQNRPIGAGAGPEPRAGRALPADLSARLAAAAKRQRGAPDALEQATAMITEAIRLMERTGIDGVGQAVHLATKPAGRRRG